MDWTTLMSTRRLASDGTLHDSPSEGPRTVFERDFDRILFSNAFRRMHDKTQVFPLPEDDVVHSRLTHSLEVSSVGRSLGSSVGQELQKLGKLPAHIQPRDLADVVSAACLAHDIGNPPFGHAGEGAIASYFENLRRLEPEILTPAQWADLLAFEGNAQGFRLLTRLQHESDKGLHLTVATLGALCKYPRDSSSDLNNDAGASRKKHGFFQQDSAIFGSLATALGLRPAVSASGAKAWSRHPLAFLVEAADDICFSVLDIEDGARLQLVDHEEALEALKPLASGKTEQVRLGAMSKMEQVGYLRALAIGQLLSECANEFVKHEVDILQGDFDISLADSMPSRKQHQALKDLAKARCYRATQVLEIELAGFEALGGLLTQFVPAVRLKCQEPELPARSKKVITFLEARGLRFDTKDLYGNILRVTDFVSGMTDRHALGTYRRLHGIAVPGRVA